MNSKQLQKTFSQVYEEFYAQHNIIYSAPFVFSRVGATSLVPSGVSIKQKLPLKMYIGLDIQEDKEIPIKGDFCVLPEKQRGSKTPNVHIKRGDCTIFDLYNKYFITNPISECLHYTKLLDSFIQQYIHTICGENMSPKTYTISLLSELPIGLGLSFDSVFSLLLATILEKISEKLGERDIVGEIFPPIEQSISQLQQGKGGVLSKKTINDLINDEKREECRLLRLAHAIESCIIGEYYLDGAIASSMISGGGPLIAFHEDLYTSTKHPQQKGLFIMHDYKYFLLSLQQLYPHDTYNPSFPIDFGIFYTGRPLVIENRYQQEIQKDFHNTLNHVQEVLKPYVQTTSGKRKPKFYTDIIAKYSKSDTNIAEFMLGFISLEMIELLRAVSRRGYSEEDIKKVVQTITKIRHIFNIFKKPSNHLVRFIDILYQQIGYRTEQLGVCYNDINTMGGSLLFTTPSEGVRNDISQVTFGLQRMIPGAEVLYISWRDGFQESGLTCEQNIFTHKPSQFINTSLLMMEVINGVGGTHFGTHDQLVGHEDVDIVLDTINMKIYAYGEKLTSKELHSQSGTIEMLLTALQYIDADISNKQLPTSSYSKSKNDMVGKIVLPLTKLVREKLNKELPLECYGGMYEYYLRLKKNNVRFGIVKRVVQV